MNTEEYHPEDPNEDAAIPAELQAFEAELAALRPRADGLDRERTAFLAGQASVQLPGRLHAISRWGWPLSFGAMTAIASSLAFVLLTQSATVIERVVYLPPAADRPADDNAPDGSDRDRPLRGSLLAQGGTADRSLDEEVVRVGVYATRFRVLEHMLAERNESSGDSRVAAEGLTDQSIWSAGSIRDVLDDSSQDVTLRSSPIRQDLDRSGANS